MCCLPQHLAGYGILYGSYLRCGVRVVCPLRQCYFLGTHRGLCGRVFGRANQLVQFQFPVRRLLLLFHPYFG